VCLYSSDRTTTKQLSSKADTIEHPVNKPLANTTGKHRGQRPARYRTKDRKKSLPRAKLPQHKLEGHKKIPVSASKLGESVAVNLREFLGQTDNEATINTLEAQNPQSPRQSPLITPHETKSLQVEALNPASSSISLKPPSPFRQDWDSSSFISTMSETVDQLKNQLRDKRVECPLGSQLFIVPRSAQESLITESTVKSTISSVRPYITEAKLADEAQQICQHARQLFATLAFIKKEKEICRFLDEGVTDKDLPLQRQFDTVINSLQWMLQRRAGSTIRTLESWNARTREKFSKAQRLMTSPVFQYGEHYELDNSAVLPFVTPNIDNEKKQEFRAGGYSEVYIKCIHPSHHGFWKCSSSSVCLYHSCSLIIVN